MALSGRLSDSCWTEPRARHTAGPMDDTSQQEQTCFFSSVTSLLRVARVRRCGYTHCWLPSEAPPRASQPPRGPSLAPLLQAHEQVAAAHSNGELRAGAPPEVTAWPNEPNAHAHSFTQGAFSGGRPCAPWHWVLELPVWRKS